jgi:hypothetical protein
VTLQLPPSLLWLVPLGALLLSFVLSMIVALVYVRLNRDVPATRPFAQALAAAGIVSAIIVLSIGDSIARGIGLVGALTVIRFRSDLKDPRDLVFAFAALATGVAAGAHAWMVAIGGTAVFLATAVLVSRPWFGRAEAFDAVLTVRAPQGPGSQEAIGAALRTHCTAFALVRVRQTGPASQEQAYQVRLQDRAGGATLVQTMKQTAHVEDAMLVTLDRPGDIVGVR